MIQTVLSLRLQLLGALLPNLPAGALPLHLRWGRCPRPPYLRPSPPDPFVAPPPSVSSWIRGPPLHWATSSSLKVWIYLHSNLRGALVGSEIHICVSKRAHGPSRSCSQRSLILAPIESAYATSYRSSIVTFWSRLWNSLPGHLRQSETLAIFKRIKDIFVFRLGCGIVTS